MSNQNDTPTIDDVDLSGIEGWEGNDSTASQGAAIPDPNEEYVKETEDSEKPIQDEDTTPIKWADVESLIPEPLHEEMRPVVEEWRRHYNRVLDETQPFRQYLESGVSARDMEIAIQIQQALIQDPKRFYDGLGETYGWNTQAPPAPAAPAKPAVQSDSDLWSFDEEEAAPNNEREAKLLQALEQQQERLAALEQQQQQTWQTQQEEVARQQGRAMLEKELAEIESKYGEFDREEVVRRAVANAAAGGEASVTRAFHELKDYETKLRQQFAAQRPPKVMGSGSGMAPAAPVELGTEDARREAALQLAMRLGANGGGVL
jgi:hypothetical protein